MKLSNVVLLLFYIVCLTSTLILIKTPLDDSSKEMIKQYGYDPIPRVVGNNTLLCCVIGINIAALFASLFYLVKNGIQNLFIGEVLGALPAIYFIVTILFAFSHIESFSLIVLYLLRVQPYYLFLIAVFGMSYIVYLLGYGLAHQNTTFPRLRNILGILSSILSIITALNSYYTNMYMEL